MINQRIKLLAHESGLLNDIDDTGCCFAGEPENHTQVQKFAELIVQECVSVIRDGTLEKPMGIWYAARIQQHFGIKKR